MGCQNEFDPQCTQKRSLFAEIQTSASEYAREVGDFLLSIGI